VKAGLEAPDLPQREREKVEEERAVGLGAEADRLARGVGIGLVVDVLEVGRLPAQTGSVIDDLAVNLAG
jgi:hypothetical protein